MEELYYYLNCNNINLFNAEKSILQLDQNKLELIINESLEIIDKLTIIHESHFNFISNSELGGGRVPCRGINCRVNNLDKLSRFSTLYGDSVLIENPLKRYRDIKEFDFETRLDLIDDLKIIYHLNPLLTSGLIKLVDTKKHLCPDCYEKLVKDNKNFAKKLENLKRYLNKEYTKKVIYKYKNESGLAKIEAIGPEELIAHGLLISRISEKEKDKFQNIVGIQKEHIFNEKEVKELNLQYDFCNNIIGDLINQHFYGTQHMANYVTNRNLDIDVIKSTNNSDMNARCNAYLKGLEHIVPYIYDISLDDLVELRKNEEEAFLVYRDSINEVLKATDGTNEKHIKEAFNDYVTKELHNVNLAVRRGKEKINRQLKKDLVIGGALVTAGVLTGILPNNIPAIIAGMGGLGYMHYVATDGLNIFSEPEEVKKNNLYFLWKVKDLKK